MTLHTADHWIKHLQLKQHIEGGWYNDFNDFELAERRSLINTYPHYANLIDLMTRE
jgi:predicted cupin superfamily sugar epimerase